MFGQRSSHAPHCVQCTKSSATSSTPTRPFSIATMLAWNAVGVWFSLRVTCITGQTSRQNLWPEEKHPYALPRHCSTNSSVSRPSPFGS